MDITTGIFAVLGLVFGGIVIAWAASWAWSRIQPPPAPPENPLTIAALSDRINAYKERMEVAIEIGRAAQLDANAAHEEAKAVRSQLNGKIGKMSQRFDQIEALASGAQLEGESLFVPPQQQQQQGADVPGQMLMFDPNREVR